MKLGTTLAMALMAAFLLSACGSTAVEDDTGDTLQGDTTCTPQCDGKECGMDGCAGFCGYCTGGLECSATGQCVEPCVAKCSGKECGDDGCGGTCGSCPTGETCTGAGVCEGSACVPDCAGKACGPNGCGGTCGTCAAGQSCTAAGQCEGGTCTPDCTGRECGSDGCNSVCGTCDAGQTCNAAGQCVTTTCTPDCAGKECGVDGCGGSCGSCAQGETCTSGQCVTTTCTPDCAGKECGLDGCGGSCGSCGAGEACEAGQCTACTPDCTGLECGDDGCGGSCGECAEGLTCQAGTCTTSTGPGDWTCDPSYYDDGEFCDCDCGAPDPDCDLPGAQVFGCADGETCVAGVCSGGGTGDWLCDPAYYGDGEFCDCDCGTSDPDCDLPGAQVFGCADGETCVAGVCSGGGTTTPTDWTCYPSYYGDGEYCDCECGVPDPDCDLADAQVFGCDAGQTCDAEGHCAGATTNTCGDVTYEGCCNNDTLSYCDNGELVTVVCGDVQPGAVCGWYAGDDTYDPGYNCGPATLVDVNGDPSGTFPMSCTATCTPDCTGKACGDDGCGGTCGTCGADEGCDANGQCFNHCGAVTYEGCCTGATLSYCLYGEIEQMDCAAETDTNVCGWYTGDADYPAGYYCGPETTSTGDPLIDPAGDPSGVFPLTCEGACVPACTNLECGDDGCGGVCGTCAAGETCTDGLCVGACQPQCAGKECGDDGCGGTCGTCADGDTCVAGACVVACDLTGFTPDGDAAAYDPDAQLLMYAAWREGTALADYLTLELWQRYGAPTDTGTYALTDENYETCTTCVLISTGCDATACEKTYLATAGDLNLVDVGVVGDPLSGWLENVTLVEVTIDPDTWVSTPVPGGQTWCLDEVLFDLTIDAWPSN